MTMFAPKVSIVIPVYNGSDYVREAIDSALGQTYGNLEVLVVNDGSTDGGATEAIARSYDDRIRYLSKENGGVASALNVAISQSTGDYISWLSHDDLYHADKIEQQVAFLSNQPRDRIIVYSDYEAIDADNRRIKTICLNAGDYSGPRAAILRLLFAATLHGCSLLLPRLCFAEVGYFDESLRTTQDYDLWFRLLSQGYEFRHLSQPLICSRWHQAQGTRVLYKIAQKEIEDLYRAAVNTFYDDIEKFDIFTIMEIIVEMRNKKLVTPPDHLLASIKVRNKELYRRLYDGYARELINSKLQLVMAMPLDIATAIIRRMGLKFGC